MRYSTSIGSAICLGIACGVASATTVETFDSGTDLGQWSLTTNPSKPRTFETSGGNPGGYLHQDNVAGGLPQWASASPRYQPGFNDIYKIDSDFTGNFAAAGVTGISMDVNIFQPGNWATDRAPTLSLARWDDVNETIAVQAWYTGPDLPDDDAPVGWNTYSFAVDAASTTIPDGWVVERGDGETATDADWAFLMQSVDLTSMGFYKPGYFYSSLGSWTEGIDNITVSTVPEPMSAGGIALLALAALRRRSRPIA